MSTHSSFILHPSSFLQVSAAVLAMAAWSSFAPSVNAQTATVRGFVTAAADREALQGVNVVVEDEAGRIRGEATDRDGFYLISRLSPGRYLLRTSFIGFETYRDTLDLAPNESRLLNIVLRDDPIEMLEIAVEAERESGGARVTAGLQTIRPEDIRLIPAPDISGDLVSYLSTLPGVVLMGDRGGQVFIRGGEPSHNLTLMDGMDVYQPFHILGFYSAFPEEIISRADVYAGGFGGRYTGRISSIIDVQTRNGNKRALSASGSISPFTGAVRLEGPLIRNHVSFLAAGRLSTLDQIAADYVPSPLPYRFNDFFGKVHAQFANYQMSFSTLQTYDRGTLAEPDNIFRLHDEIRWRNRAYGVRYLSSPSAVPVLGELLVSYSEVRTELGPSESPTRSSLNKSVNLGVNMTHYAEFGKVDWGFAFRAPTLQVEVEGLFQNFTAGLYRALHVGSYVEPEIYLGRGLYARPGVALQVYADEGAFMDPRLRLRWERGAHHWSGAVGLYRQEIIGIGDRRDATNIFTAWVGAPSGGTARGVHALLGYRVTPAGWLEASVEGFYKSLDHLPITEWTAFPAFSMRLQEAHGRAAGFDLRLEVRRPGFYFLVNYGYSSTRYEIVPGSPVLVNPGPFRPPHDRRHQVNVLANQAIFGFDLSARWHFGSGLPYTQIKGFDGFILMDGAVDLESVPGLPRVIYDEIPYRAVLPTYHRLDVSIERVFGLARGVNLTGHVGAINLYDRANIFTLDLFTAQRTDQLPFVPVAGVKVEV